MATTQEPSQEELVAEAERIIAEMPHKPACFEGRKAVASYHVGMDMVDMPDRKHFASINEYYLAYFHELTHSTGHASRLARPSLVDNKASFGSGTYSREELVAEMGAAFLSAHAGLPGDDHQSSAAYLQGWLKVLKAKENRKWIVQAAGQAQKASDYVLEVS